MEPALRRAIKAGLEELGADVHLGHAVGKGKVSSILAWGVLMSIPGGGGVGRAFDPG